MERVHNEQDSLFELKDKNVILLMGITGSGKSTIANALIKGPSKISLDDGLFNVAEPIIYNNEIIFKIGH